MNEAGLVANVLYLAGTKYGDRDPGRELKEGATLSWK